MRIQQRGYPIFTAKIRQSLRLVQYGASARFHIYVCGLYWHTHTMMCQSPPKCQACWCMSHRWGNQCHLVTWIKTITPRWLCTQYSMNMHLRQLPWAHTHSTRLRALITRKGHSCSHESTSYKVHNHPHTHKHIYIYTYIHTYIMHNAITQSKKVNQTLPMFQGYDPARYRKCKTDIAIPKECGLSME